MDSENDDGLNFFKTSCLPYTKTAPIPKRSELFVKPINLRR